MPGAADLPTVASLGFRTDLMVLTLGGSRVEHGTRGDLVVRTPANPGFWWGNFLLVPSAAALDGALERFRAHVPDAAHVAIGVDETVWNPATGAAAEALGLGVERSTILRATSLQPPPRPNRDATIRALEPAADEEWVQMVGIQLADDPVGGDPAAHRAFAERRVAGLRDLQRAGHGACFGAWLDGALRASLGVFTDGHGLARFQTVDTLAAYRGRGLAGTLVHHAGAATLARPDVDELVIAADPADHAIGIYRSVGFADGEEQLQLQRAPAG